MEDPLKVQQKINDLNSNDPQGALKPWIHYSGYFALTRVELNDGVGPVFNPSIGIPMKVFTHQLTGEIRMFPSQFFER